MKTSISEPHSHRLIPLCFTLVGMSVLLGILMSYRMSGGIFADAASLVRELTIDGAAFGDSFKNAFFGNLVFCVTILFFSAAFPLSFLPGAYLLFKGFCLGAAVGLVAKTCILKDAVGIFFAVFISNFLGLPLKILLFLSSINFSLRSCELSGQEKTRGYMGFVLKTLVFFILMCISECIQLGIGVGILSRIQ